MGGLFLDSKMACSKAAIRAGRRARQAGTERLRSKPSAMKAARCRPPPNSPNPSSPTSKSGSPWARPIRAKAPPVALEASAIDIEKGRKYWAFQPPQKPAIRQGARTASGPPQPIDRFLLARMEQKHLTPVADADRTTWLRRVTLDLTGLPPTPDEIDAFSQGSQPRRLRQSGRSPPRLARASASAGAATGWTSPAMPNPSAAAAIIAFPDAWRYRNYVIDAFQ